MTQLTGEYSGRRASTSLPFRLWSHNHTLPAGNRPCRDERICILLDSTMDGPRTPRSREVWLGARKSNEGERCLLVFNDHVGGLQNDLFTWLSAADIVCKLFTGRYPFHESRLDAQVINKVLSGKRPPRLENAKSLGLSDEVWQIMERCWKEDRRKRPRISSALQDLKRAFYFTDQSIPIPKHLTFDIPPIREKEKPKVTLGVIDQTLKVALKPIPIASKLYCPSTK